MEKEVVSVCEKCYRHIDCIKYEKNGSIYIDKICPTHGKSTHLIEPDGEFYLNYHYNRHSLKSYFIEITNRCNLACPHCYQMPDNQSQDDFIEDIIEKIKKWPRDGYPVALVGAEPTIRQDLDEIIQEIKKIDGPERDVMILTNGVRLGNKNYADKFKNIKNLHWTFGLNHKDYLGPAVRKKQMQGIHNCIERGMHIKNISYTLLDMSQLDFCVKEIVEFGENFCDQFRIRCGADIGRTPEDSDQIYLSQLLNETKEKCTENNFTIEENPSAGNRAHYPVYINGLSTKIIQWPDATTLDLSEMQTEAIADILPGKPRSPLVHQVILRDGSVNQGVPLQDTIPDYVLREHGIIK